MRTCCALVHGYGCGHGLGDYALSRHHRPLRCFLIPHPHIRSPFMIGCHHRPLKYRTGLSGEASHTCVRTHFRRRASEGHVKKLCRGALAHDRHHCRIRGPLICGLLCPPAPASGSGVSKWVGRWVGRVRSLCGHRRRSPATVVATGHTLRRSPFAVHPTIAVIPSCLETATALLPRLPPVPSMRWDRRRGRGLFGLMDSKEAL